MGDSSTSTLIQLNQFIEHTNLKPNLVERDIVNLCEESSHFNFANVCVLPSWIKFIRAYYPHFKPDICTVVGFPLGNHFQEVKVKETQMALTLGANDIDMVVNISDVLQGKWHKIREEIGQVKKAMKGHPQAKLKLIFETCYLNKDEIIYLCEVCMEEGVDYVKTSTGFGPSGATVEDVKVMAHTCNGKIGVKASGGIREIETCLAMIEAGATRIGTSAGVQLISAYQQLNPNFML